MGDSGGELFSKSCCSIGVEAHIHLCDHDSTIWVHFCLLEFLMLWWICPLSSCIYESEGKEMQGSFLSIMSRLVISMRLGIMLGM